MGKIDLSRRSFLKAAMIGAAGAGVSAAGLAGCAPKQGGAGATGAAESSAASAAESDVIAAALLNPQDYDYRQNTTDFKTLFSPWSFGSINLGHRMVKSAAGSACYLSGLGDELFEYYVNFAKGGVEMIWVEGEAFSLPQDGSAVPQETIDFFKNLQAECAKYGSHLGYQWAYFGVSPATLTVEQIEQIQDAGAATAVALKEMGFEAFEINAAGFNMGEQFLSRFHNTRTDEYGVGSIEDRARFVVECIGKIKAACGNDFAVQVLIDAIEENDNLSNNATLMTLDNAVTEPHNKATTLEEGIAFAQLFEEAGADALHLRLGPLGNHPCQFGSDLYFLLNGVEGATGYGTQWDFKKHWQGQLIADHSGAGMLIDVVARYKEAVKIPCGTVTYMDPAHAPDFFEAALSEGKVDFYIMNRPLTVDFEYVNKLREGRIDEIVPCTRCLHCHIGSNEMNAMMGYCRVNALTQRVMREGGPAMYEVPAASSKKKVMVVGGGPAGMEAARVAAQRGHEVSLYEKKSSLGGSLPFASLVKGPHENLDDLNAYLQKQCKLAGVSIVTGTEVTADVVAKEAPDAVILAVGGARPDLEVSGGTVVDLADFMSADLGENVIVYGSNAQAFDTALWLTVHKKNVQIVTPSADNELDMQQSQHAQRFMTTALYGLGVKVWPNSSIKSASDGKLLISSKDAGVDVTLACDSIVNAADMQANAGLLDELSVAEKVAVGDCSAPFNIALAIRSGNDAGRAV